MFTCKKTLNHKTNFYFTKWYKDFYINIYIRMNPDYQYLIDFERKIKEQMAIGNLNYRKKNRDKINQLAKNYYNKNKDNEEFKLKMRQRAKAYYQKKRAQDLGVISDS